MDKRNKTMNAGKAETISPYSFLLPCIQKKLPMAGLADAVKYPKYNKLDADTLV